MSARNVISGTDLSGVGSRKNAKQLVYCFCPKRAFATTAHKMNPGVWVRLGQAARDAGRMFASAKGPHADARAGALLARGLAREFMLPQGAQSVTTVFRDSQ